MNSLTLNLQQGRVDISLPDAHGLEEENDFVQQIRTVLWDALRMVGRKQVETGPHPGMSRMEREQWLAELRKQTTPEVSAATAALNEHLPLDEF